MDEEKELTEVNVENSEGEGIRIEKYGQLIPKIL